MTHKGHPSFFIVNNNALTLMQHPDTLHKESGAPRSRKMIWIVSGTSWPLTRLSLILMCIPSELCNDVAFVMMIGCGIDYVLFMLSTQVYLIYLSSDHKRLLKSEPERDWLAEEIAFASREYPVKMSCLSLGANISVDSVKFYKLKNSSVYIVATDEKAADAMLTSNTAENSFEEVSEFPKDLFENITNADNQAIWAGTYQYNNPSTYS